jgi:transcriptional regulator with XRE-family HTH domain
MTKRGGWPPTGFGERLRAIRNAAGLSQKALAERARCNLFTVAKLERGAQEPAWPLVLALAEALGVNCLAFLQEPADRPAAQRGRPRKDSDGAPDRPAAKGKRPAGRRPKGR